MYQTQPRSPTVLLLGEAQPWEAALHGLSRPLQRFEGAWEGIDGVLVGAGVHDPFSRAREALAASRGVLYAAPFTLSPWQAASLRALARSRGAPLRYPEAFRRRPGFGFLERMLEGREPLWRPFYLRSLCLAPGGARIDELATEELAMCDALLEAAPLRVTASAGRRPEGSDVCAAFLTIEYQGGVTVQCTISLAEGASSRQLVAVASDHTTVMEHRDGRASVRVTGGEHETVHEERDVDDGEALRHAIEDEASSFIATLASRGGEASNADRWVRVASVWWAARQSMSFGEPVEVPRPSFRAANTEPPPFKVIQGGGRSTRQAARARPLLTVVSP